jgi:hypothetical protein
MKFKIVYFSNENRNKFNFIFKIYLKLVRLIFIKVILILKIILLKF